jgi:hypothetical protein
LDFQERTLGELSEHTITDEDGKQVTLDEFIAQQAGVSKEELAEFKDRGVKMAEIRAIDPKDRTEEQDKELEKLTEQQFETYSKLQEKMGAGTTGRAEFMDDLELRAGLAVRVTKKDSKTLMAERDEMQEELDEMEAQGTQDTAEGKELQAEILKRQQALEGKREMFDVEYLQGDGTETAAEKLQDRMEFQREESTMRGRTYEAIRELAGEELDEAELEAQIQDVGADTEEGKKLQKDLDIVRGLEVGETSEDVESNIERITEREEELQKKISKETDADKKKELEADLTEVQAEKGEEEERLARSKELTTGKTLSRTREFMREQIVSGGDLLETLTESEGIESVIGAGVSASEIRKTLSASETELEKKIDKEQDPDKKDEFKERLEQVRAAKEKLKEHYKEGDGGLLADLVDVLTQIAGGSRPIAVKVQGGGSI